MSLFFLTQVAVLGSSKLRVVFSVPPKTTSALHTGDALNISNYTLSGSTQARILSAVTVMGNDDLVDLIVDTPLGIGKWVLAIAPSMVSADQSPAISPTSIAFEVTSTPYFSNLTGGATQDSSADIIRKHIPASYKGPKWGAIIAGLAVGDDQIRADIRAAWNQLFLGTASGVYLDRLSGNSGIERPANVGMGDESYRELAIRLSTNKLTEQSLINILEVFYGTDLVSAHMDTAHAEPYALDNGHELKLFDGKNSTTITFVTEDFATISKASALEVAAAISSICTLQGFSAYAVAQPHPTESGQRVRLYSKRKGLGSRMVVEGGLAQDVLLFPQALNVEFVNL